MYALTRGSTTLIAAGVAGLLVWTATQIGFSSNGEYWGSVGVLAGAGLIMALSQLLGGWTKWGWPRVSASVFLVAFIPVLIAAGWVILANQHGANWFQRHTYDWSHDIGLGSLVDALGAMVPVLAFGVGLVFGFIFDTTGPRAEREPMFRRRVAPAPPATEPTPPEPDSGEAEAERRRAATEAGTPVAPQPETPTEEERASR